MRIKWLHLSDIHFNYKNFDSRILRKDFITRIKNISQSEKFTHLFLTGDVLDKYNPSDLSNDQTINFINGLISAMGIEMKNVFIVPGNHDHNRAKTIELTKDIYSNTLDDKELCDKIRLFNNDKVKALLGSFEKFCEIYQKITANSYFVDATNPHHIENLNGLSIVKINTAWLDIDSNEENQLYCGADKLLDLLEVNEADLNTGINLAVGHHPLDMLATNERERILNLFQRYKIGLYLCGHVHIPSIKYFNTYDVLQLASIGGFADGYSKGGYVSGICDTDNNLYKAEFYNWNTGSWYVESSLEGTNERGICYFDTKRFKNNSNVVAVDFKLYDEHISQKVLSESIGDDNFDTLIYPYSGINPSAIDWTLHEKETEDFSDNIKHLISNSKQVHIFPLAPIPLLIKLGFELQKNSKLSIHQQDRSTNNWNLIDKEENIQFNVNKRINGNSELVVKIATSNEIDSQLIEDSFVGKSYDVLDFTANKIGLGSPLYMNDVNRMVETIFSHLNPVATKYNKIHLIAAVPAGMALEIGRNLLKSVYYNVYTYQYYRGKYCEAIVINKEDLENNRQSVDNNIISIEKYQEKIVLVPLVGKIACGDASDPVFEVDGYMPMSKSIIGNGDFFILTASGDSMINAGINDGDLVLIRQQNTAENGQIVVALIGNDTTLKRFYRDDKNQQLILKPENSAYQEKVYKDLKIQGIAIKVIKSL